MTGVNGWMIGLVLVVVPMARAGAQAGPVFDAGGPDAAAYGQAAGYPLPPWGQWGTQVNIVASHSHFDRIFPSSAVAHAATPWSFVRAAAEPEIRYDYQGGQFTIKEFLAHVPVTGLLVVHGDTILAEHYQYGRTDHDPLVSNSMTKTVVALLLGAAVGQGRIHSVDDSAAAYVPTLRGSAYGATPLRALLHMSSGIRFDESADGQFWKDLFSDSVEAGAALTKLDHRTGPPGTHFSYSCGDSQALVTVLRHAVGTSLAAYLAETIWRPIGAEADAHWAVAAHDQETGCYGFNAVLRDYGRLGRLLANDGAWNGRQLIPRQWMLDATTIGPADGQVAPGVASHFYGYGYQLWVLPGPRRMFALIGAEGQYLFVDPAAKLVLVQTAVRVDTQNVASARVETLALWGALVRRFAGT